MANLQSLFPKAVNYFGEKRNPERSLWRNVLIVALEDAVGRHWRNKSYGSPGNNFYGRVKDVKVFRRTLTDSEMAELTNNIT